MARLALQSGALHAEIDAACGASITDFSIEGPAGDRFPMMRRAPGLLESSSLASCFLLAPWSNRIADAAFSFDGRDHVLRPNFPDGTAIHGDTRDRPWRITDRTPVSARLVFDSREHERVNFPWPFACVVRYELRPDALRVDLSVTNLGGEPVPAGCGLHPFFVRRLFSDADEVRLRAPVGGRYPCHNQLAEGPHRDDDACARLRAGGPTEPGLDDCFGGFEGRAQITWPASGVSMTIDCSDALDHLVVFTPTRDGDALPWFCVEPVTHANDAFNLEGRGVPAGSRTLDPGETLSTTTTFHVRTE
ncbi:MAG: aldose 1-epimerase [Phycisphaerales bacterium]